MVVGINGDKANFYLIAYLVVFEQILYLTGLSNQKDSFP
jgi:hypothetical protein